MSLEKLEKEIATQRAWNEDFQKEFIEECLKAQGKLQFVDAEDIEMVHGAYKNHALGDESIQYYVRIFLEFVYDVRGEQ
jgi:hypothetical protein